MRSRRRPTRPASLRRLLVDGIDDDIRLTEPDATAGQPDGYGWDWDRWRRR